MKELLEYIVKGIVTNPHKVKIEEVEDGIKIKVDKEDKGKIIGKNGRVINAIRIILSIQKMGKVNITVD
uniref:KH domain-containing protein n=1 Tax=candidate division CPR3 bacterium TaxID=2268181 RepID=A0A7C5UVX6_UNCC3